MLQSLSQKPRPCDQNLPREKIIINEEAKDKHRALSAQLRKRAPSPVILKQTHDLTAN